MKIVALFSIFVLFIQLLIGQTITPQIDFYPNGQKQSENYRLSSADTICKNKEWYEDGTIKQEQIKMGSLCISKHYYKNGKLESLTEEIPAYDQISKELFGYQLKSVTNYCENGQQTENIDHTLKGKKQFTILNCKGDTLINGTVIDNFMNKTGKWVYRWENLNKKVEGNYKETEILEDTGIRIGKWTYWSEAGKIVLEQWFNDEGELLK